MVENKIGDDEGVREGEEGVAEKERIRKRRRRKWRIYKGGEEAKKKMRARGTS